MTFLTRLSVCLSILAGLTAVISGQTPTPAATPQRSTSKVTVKYDKSKDTTTVTLKPVTLTRVYQEKQRSQDFPLHQLQFEASFRYKGQTPTEAVEEVTIRFNSLGSNYVFLRNQEVIVAIDRLITGKDRAFSLGMTNYKSISPKFNSVYEEIMELNAPADALVKLTNAETVDIYFGPLMYGLTKKQHEAVKEFRSFLPAKK